MASVDPAISFQSEFVCENIARRVVKGYRFQSAAATAFKINSALAPLSATIATAGKLPKGTLLRTANNLKRKLASEPSLISFDIHRSQYSRLSSQEAQRMTYVLAVSSDESEDWVDFLANEMTMTRTQVEAAASMVDFRIHRHALARFMNRELRPAEDIMTDMQDAMHMGTMIGYAAMKSGVTDAAIPIGNAMLFGRVDAIRNASSPPFQMCMKINRAEGAKEYSRAADKKGHRPLVKVMTYVDSNSLTSSREALRDVLVAFREQHRDAMRYIFDSFHYTYLAIDTFKGKTLDALHGEMKAAIDAMVEVMRGPEYTRYVETVGRG